MSPFITFRDFDSINGLQYYILQREYPHYLSVIAEEKKYDLIIQPQQITGYYLWVNFCGTLRGNIIPGYLHIQEDIKFVLNEMAEWYYINRVVPQHKKFKKFKYD
jgi:hypothetical protein